ncbi:MAG: hypothetical protein U0234_29880 [Sandaracinus sp.]
MKRATYPLLLSLAALALGSCATPTVSLSLGFPSQEAFLVTTNVDIYVVPLGGDLTQCATLLNAAVQGADVPASASFTNLTPCSLLGRAVLPDPGGDPSAFIVLGRATNGVILGGCSVAQAYPGGPEIRVELFPTDTSDYDDAVTAAHLAPGSTADQRCAGSTP